MVLALLEMENLRGARYWWEKPFQVLVFFIFFSYEQLTKLHPEVEDYKLYYAQVSENFLILYSTTICQFHFITSFSVIFAIVAIILIYFYIL